MTLFKCAQVRPEGAVHSELHILWVRWRTASPSLPIRRPVPTDLCGFLCHLNQQSSLLWVLRGLGKENGLSPEGS